MANEPTPTDAEINALAEAYLLRMFGSRVVFNGTMIDFARAVLAKWGSQPVVPAGYALVPVEPTPKMLAAAAIMRWRYDALLAAAPPPPAQAADSMLEGAARLAKITQAIRDYHFALDCREHGGVAMARAWNAICDVLNMDWVQGAESAARKQGANHD